MEMGFRYRVGESYIDQGGKRKILLRRVHYIDRITLVDLAVPECEYA